MGIRPVDVRHKTTQLFGTNPGGHNPPGGHTGEDIGAPEGTPVYAMEDGVVTHADWGAKLPGDDSHEGWASRLYLKRESVGIGVVLKHASYYSTYSHLSRTDLNLGDVVKRGQVIGYIGNTGLSYGSHLHWEVLPLNPNYANGTYGRINPRLFLSNTTQKTEASNMGYTYSLITKWTSPNQSTRASFGHTGKLDSAVIHWWDDPSRAGTFEGTASWLCDTRSGVSAHYIISGRNVACLVSPDFAAWHSGSGPMNGRSVGLELDPRNPAGTLETAAQVLYEIEKAYNTSLYVYGHKDVVSTGCPGTFYGQIPQIIEKVNALHASGGKAPSSPAPKPKPVPPKPKPATAGPVWTATDNALVHDINGNKRTLRQVLSFRFNKYEKNIKTTEALAKRVAELEKKVK